MKATVEMTFLESSGSLTINFRSIPRTPLQTTAQMKQVQDRPVPFGQYQRHSMSLIAQRRRTGLLGRSEWTFGLIAPADWDGKGSKPGGMFDLSLAGARKTDARSFLDVLTLPGDVEALAPIFDDPESDVTLFYKNYP
ncbi:MAG TPA: hypothetical protein VMS17_31695 [Gemmataceae bacterium]|nr:hypothetical protein [Gemmataceae bacterium]